jgi:hypothetical protein
MAIVHCERKSDHLRDDHRTARPRPDYALIPGAVSRLNFLVQMDINKRTLFQRPRHFSTDLFMRTPVRLACQPWTALMYHKRIGSPNSTAYGLYDSCAHVSFAYPEADG